MRKNKTLRWIITALDLEFNATQYKWGRKLFGGNWYLISIIQLRMASFWSDDEIKSCQAETLSVESYPLPI